MAKETERKEDSFVCYNACPFRPKNRFILPIGLALIALGVVFFVLPEKPFKTKAFNAASSQQTIQQYEQVQYLMNLDQLSRKDIIYNQQFKFQLSKNDIEYLHTKNTKIKVLKYRSATEVYDTDNSRIADPIKCTTEGGQTVENWCLKFAQSQNTDSEWRDIWLNHQDWFLKNDQGSYIHRKDPNGSAIGNPIRAYVMDPSNSEWAGWLAVKSSQYTVNEGFDGVFLDLAANIPYIDWETMPSKYRGETGKAQWRKDIINLVNTVKVKTAKNKFGNNIIVYNGVNTGNEYYDNYSPYPIEASIADGVVFEGFYRWANDPDTFYRDEKLWLKDVQLVERIGNQQKMLLVNTDFFSFPENSYDQKLRAANYAFSSFLLGKSGSKTYFHFATNDSNLENYITNFSNIKIGLPVERLRKVGVSYQRRFEGGFVVVNPNKSESYTMKLSKKYHDQYGNVLSDSFTLPPKSSKIIIDDITQ